MKHTISNDKIVFISDSFNVEPWALSFKGEDVNYVWHTPEGEKLGTAICFPLLGTLPDNTYRFAGKEYRMLVHGFAQDMDFTLAGKTENSIVYEITDTRETLKQFPWRFKFTVAYSLEDRALRTEYTVQNRDKSVMFFSLGGHPRYSYTFEDYYIEFEKSESIKNIVKSYGPISAIEKCFSADGKRIKLDYTMFEKGCFCFSPLNSNFLYLKNNKSQRGLKIDIKGVTHLQFWAMPNMPYLAIEPFYGSITSLPPKAADGDWKERKGTLQLELGAEFVCAYKITLLK